MAAEFVHKVELVKEGIRLSDYLIGRIGALPSRKSVKKAILAGEVWVDDLKGTTGTYVRAGMVIRYTPKSGIQGPSLKLSIPVLFEDDHLAVVAKPAGIVVSGNTGRSLFRALPYNLKKTSSPDALKSPTPAHRIDRPTSGLVLVAKDRQTLVGLHDQFQNKTITKTYRVIVHGKLERGAAIQTPVEGKEAWTGYSVLGHFNHRYIGPVTYCEAEPVTGRTHQIRIHLAQKGYPVVGDDKYGSELDLNPGKGLFLHAYKLGFTHPITQDRMEFKTGEPNKFIRLLGKTIA